MTVREAIAFLSACDPDKQLDAEFVLPDRSNWVGAVESMEDGPCLSAIILHIPQCQRVPYDVDGTPVDMTF